MGLSTPSCRTDQRIPLRNAVAARTTGQGVRRHRLVTICPMHSSLVLSSVVLAGLLAGARFAYSGPGINLLQFVLERGLGLDVHAELRRRVFQHFDTRHTSMTWQPDSADNLAGGYTSKGESRPHPRRTRTVAASSMDTRSRTLRDFLRAFRRRRLVDCVARGHDRTAGIDHHCDGVPTFQAELPAARQRTDLASGLGVVVFDGPQGPGFFKGGHEDFAGITWFCLQRSVRCRCAPVQRRSCRESIS